MSWARVGLGAGPICSWRIAAATGPQCYGMSMSSQSDYYRAAKVRQRYLLLREHLEALDKELPKEIQRPFLYYLQEQLQTPGRPKRSVDQLRLWGAKFAELSKEQRQPYYAMYDADMKRNMGRDTVVAQRLKEYKALSKSLLSQSWALRKAQIRIKGLADRIGKPKKPIAINLFAEDRRPGERLSIRQKTGIWNDATVAERESVLNRVRAASADYNQDLERWKQSVASTNQEYLDAQKNLKDLTAKLFEAEQALQTFEKDNLM